MGGGGDRVCGMTGVLSWDDKEAVGDGGRRLRYMLAGATGGGGGTEPPFSGLIFLMELTEPQLSPSSWCCRRLRR